VDLESTAEALDISSRGSAVAELAHDAHVLGACWRVSYAAPAGVQTAIPRLDSSPPVDASKGTPAGAWTGLPTAFRQALWGFPVLSSLRHGARRGVQLDSPTTEMSPSDWIAAYAALLSTVIAVVASFGFVARRIKKRRERAKFQTDLYFLRKVDRRTQEVHPIVVVLLANLGTERIALKSLEYSGVTENGLQGTGSMGWYEQPDELFGIRKRLLPVVLESGQTADLPMIGIGVITRNTDLKIWLTDFDGRRYYLAEDDITEVRRDIEKFLVERKS
jgi:hypothetical protein